MRITQRAIKHALTERYYSWKDALEVAKKDPEINLSGDGPLLITPDYIEEQEEAQEDEKNELLPREQGSPEIKPSEVHLPPPRAAGP